MRGKQTGVGQEVCSFIRAVREGLMEKVTFE